MELSLGQNRLSGPIPRSFGEAIVNLLDLSRNRLTGDASFLFGSNKTALETIYLNHNHFKFDFSNVDLPMGIRDLNIQHNELYGSLPKRLAQPPLWNDSDLPPAQACQARQHRPQQVPLWRPFAPLQFGKNKTMLELTKLDHNNLKFDFSNLDLPMGISTLDISHNETYGSLPKLLGQLPLQSINVSYNNLCGMIPTGRRL
ncbi:hypothetical protein Cgig2_012139 [Carnegiea gigantea]|uniref:Uncharacterized protein n=1 Tax=Carnegiea gigantea TaxID=171969 RepID=A0A9Q1KSY2_9CARY|nr:hypothetical protein Cgig2_012139 [Carnegiea gigantea]